MQPQDTRDRYHGALIGAMLGDALGAPFVGWDSVSPESYWHGVHRCPMGTTVASDFLLAASRCLIDSAVAPLPALDNALRERQSGDRQEKGAKIQQLLGLVGQGIEWDCAERLLSTRVGVTSDLAVIVAIPTTLIEPHQSQSLEADAGLLAAALTTALSWDEHVPVTRTAFMERLRRAFPQSAAPLALDAEFQPPAQAEHPAVLRQLERLAAAGPATIAVSALLGGQRGFIESVYLAARVGGETNTQSLLAGALIGACIGAKRLPSAPVAQLPSSVALREVAEALHRRAAGVHAPVERRGENHLARLPVEGHHER